MPQDVAPSRPTRSRERRLAVTLEAPLRSAQAQHPSIEDADPLGPVLVGRVGVYDRWRASPRLDGSLAIELSGTLPTGLDWDPELEDEPSAEASGEVLETLCRIDACFGRAQLGDQLSAGQPICA